MEEGVIIEGKKYPPITVNQFEYHNNSTRENSDERQKPTSYEQSHGSMIMFSVIYN